MKKIKCAICGKEQDADFDLISIENLPDFPVIMCDDCFEKAEREQDSECPEDDDDNE